MFSPSKVTDDSLLDRARIRIQISELTKKHQEFIKQLPDTIQKPDSSDFGSVDSKIWYQARSDLYSVTSKLENLLEIAEQTQPEQSTSEWQTAVLTFQEADETCRVLRLLSVVYAKMDRCHDLLAEKKFADAASELVDLKRQINDLGREERYGLKLISGLKARRIEVHSALSVAVEQQWKNLIYIRSGQSVDDLAKDIVGIRLQYAVNDIPFPALLAEVLRCLKVLRIFEKSISEMADNLWEHVLHPVMNGATIRVVCDSATQTQTLFVVPWHPSGAGIDCASILDEIYQVLDFLQTNLFVLGSPLNEDIITAIRNQIGNKFTKSIEVDAVARRLPDNFEEYSACKPDLCEKLSELERFMAKSGWIAVDDTVPRYYEKVLDELYIHKRAQGLLAVARALCLSEKDILTSVRKPADPEPEKADLVGFGEVGNPHVFVLQEMLISRSMAEIMDRSVHLMQTAQSCDLVNVLVPALYTGFSFWLDLVPYHFKERIVTVPALGALYFTSCIHGSLHLYVLNRMAQQSTAGEQGSPALSTSFADLIIKFRTKAYEVLDSMVIKSCRDIVETVHSGQTAWLSKISVTKLDDILNRACLKNGLDLVQRLSAVWSDILPLIVFLQAVGKVIDAVITDTIARLLMVEDINATDSAALCENFKWILSESEKMLRIRPGADVVPFKYVPSWLQCQEVIFVLDASMSQIMERWADGNGPLAEHLAPDQLKRLIRALFENNDKRARLLAAIR